MHKPAPRTESQEEEWQQSLESIVSGMNIRETAGETLSESAGEPVTEAAESETVAETCLQRINYSSDGRAYTPYASISDWDTASEEKRESYASASVPVLQDWNMTIDSICMDSLSRTTRSYILGRQLYAWCEKQGIPASQGEYLAYRNYIAPGKESFYVMLDDEAQTLIVCQSVSHGLYWKFSLCEESRETVEKLRDLEQKDRVEQEDTNKTNKSKSDSKAKKASATKKAEKKAAGEKSAGDKDKQPQASKSGSNLKSIEYKVSKKRKEASSNG